MDSILFDKAAYINKLNSEIANIESTIIKLHQIIDKSDEANIDVTVSCRGTNASLTVSTTVIQFMIESNEKVLDGMIKELSGLLNTVDLQALYVVEREITKVIQNNSMDLKSANGLIQAAKILNNILEGGAKDDK